MKVQELRQMLSSAERSRVEKAEIKSIECVKKNIGSGRMKKVLGFALFCMALGMFIMMLLPNLVWGVIILVGLLLTGYRLFCC